MSKVRIVFGSETGNTESIAKMLADEISAAGHEVNCESAANVKASGLGDGYDCVLMGVSVWGIDTIELQDDFAAYDGSFDSMNLEGKKCAAFASGDTSYEYYCGGVDYIEEQLKDVKADLITDGLRVEGDASGSADEVKAFAQDIIKAL